MNGAGFPRGKAAIVGAATYGIGKCPRHDAVDMAAKASLLALQDAGLRLSDVDALYTSAPYEALGGLQLAEYLGVQTKLTDCNRTGGIGLRNIRNASGGCPVARANQCSADCVWQQSSNHNRQRRGYDASVRRTRRPTDR